MIGNLLSLAMSVTGTQPVSWAKFKSRSTNSAGHVVPTYYAARPITGQAQPISQKLYQALGLDWNKKYITLYTPAGVVSVDREGSGDKITYNGETYLAESDTDWSAQAGWKSVVCGRVPA